MRLRHRRHDPDILDQPTLHQRCARLTNPGQAARHDAVVTLVDRLGQIIGLDQTEKAQGRTLPLQGAGLRVETGSHRGFDRPLSGKQIRMPLHADTQVAQRFQTHLIGMVEASGLANIAQYPAVDLRLDLLQRAGIAAPEGFAARQQQLFAQQRLTQRRQKGREARVLQNPGAQRIGDMHIAATRGL